MFVENSLRRALKRMRLFPDTPLMVAVSGGKDSLVVWDLLRRLGYSTRGLHINLGIGEFSRYSSEAVANFAEARDLSWSEYPLKESFGFTMPEIQRAFREKICSLCGKLKRHFFNKHATDEGFGVLVTGHNLDDEASRLLGNLIGNRQRFVRKQYPLLRSPHPAMPAKAKPLFRLEDEEIGIYATLAGIDVLQTVCPFAADATSHAHKRALDLLEAEMPGQKRKFYFSYMRENGRRENLEDTSGFGRCEYCGAASREPVCGVCKLYARVEEWYRKRELPLNQ
ncbi:MAG: adenine nucleotide alpha hydrolase family protein [Synergistales bacterium]|nr:adenine nucleotide alpha hydrolase family protein [Synergistales bacterium]